MVINDNLMQKVQGGVTIQYVYSSGPAPIAEKNVSTGEWTNFIQANGETWAMKTGGTTKYFHKDQIGSVVALSDGSGTVTDTFQYDPWGNTVSRTGTTQTDYGFVGGHGVRTLSNGQMVMGRRIYDPQIGRFTTRDPIGFRGGDVNLYRYTGNRPLGAIDPSGLKKDYWWNFDEATGERIPDKPNASQTEYGTMSVVEAVKSSWEEVKEGYNNAPGELRRYWGVMSSLGCKISNGVAGSSSQAAA